MENRILVVDDEKEIRDFLYKALTRLGGFHVEVAETAEEALHKIEKEPFDLVMTDLKMPKMDGLQLMAEIAKSKPEILTIMMTGHGTIDSALEAMKRGASDYLMKPLNLDELIIRIQKVLEERQRFVRLKDFADKLERANQELRKIDAMKSEFVSVASHELRTPLAAIKNSVQLMLSGKTGEINENQAKFLSMAERNINRLTNILNDLLNLSRIESGKIELKFENLELRQLIELTASSLRPQADGKSIQIEVEVPEQIPAVYGDPEKIEQILTNLIGNSIKFTPDGGKILITAKFLSPERRGRTSSYSRCLCKRHRDWNSIGAFRIHLRKISSGGRLTPPISERNRIRPCHHKRIGGSPSRENLGGERGGKREHIYIHLARFSRREKGTSFPFHPG